MVIIDTGLIVALFDESESLHETCKATLKKIKCPLVTSWAVMTESFYLFGDWQKGQTIIQDTTHISISFRASRFIIWIVLILRIYPLHS